MFTMCVGIWVFCIFYCFFKKKYRFTMGEHIGTDVDYIHGFVEVLILFAVFMLITANRTGSDIINYYNRYTYSSNVISWTELLYNYAGVIGNRLGLNFYEFRAVLTFITSGAAVLVLKKLDINICFFMIFYIPSLMFMDSMQVRNAVAFSFLLVAIYFMTDEKEYKGSIIFSIVLLIAIGFHTMYLVYFFLLLYRMKVYRNKKLIGCLFILSSLIVSVLTFLNSNTIPYLDWIYSLFLSESDARATRYLTTGHFGFLYPTVLLLISFYLISSICKNYVNNNCRSYRFTELSLFTTQLTFCSVPFMMMNLNYYRLPRNVFILAILSTIVFVENKNNSKKLKKKYIFELAILCFLWWFFELFIYQSTQLIIDPVLKNGIWFFI